MQEYGSEAERQIAQLLRTARTKLGLSVAFLSRIDETTRTLQIVDSALPSIQAGYSGPRDTGFCLAVVEGRLPQVLPDARTHPEAVRLHPADLPQIGPHISVPVVLSDGELYGTFCAFGLTTEPDITARDVLLMEILAEAAAMVIEPQFRLDQQHAVIRDRLAPVLEAGGPDVVLQPIVSLCSGARIGAEALSRFPLAWERSPDVVFDEAHRIGEGDRLELLALARAVALLDRVPGYVSVNVSPQTVVTRACGELLARLPLDRVLLELSEHDPVHDYAVLTRALAPLRERGMRLAIDDVGAGFSSLRHIVMAAPDVIKLDRSIISGVDQDPVLTKLAQSMVEFAHSFGASVIAEGVETAEEFALLRSLGVDGGQGWLFGGAAPPDQLADLGVVLALPPADPRVPGPTAPRA
ncbi:EAL domain-containing protein [Blastococcus sp. TF02A_35]|uniref:sensor domain-containing phosphodiesterase n=1 Tax=Blastococcus sp. TF02A-35 TaxID=2559612 RepID=UPI001073F307|nr:EAL domain-containing protein [Blastococcus sp. TF02A_35]TFV48908.1 EAL domain-containing protein [Blastococcus sp. TF02A_35]